MQEKKPHVLALTEFGASSAVMDSELGMNGYSLYRGNHSDGKGGLGKGAALYISNSLNHSACPLFDEVLFDCSAWSIIKLARNKSLLVGVIYRSPNSTDQNNHTLLEIMKKASRSNHTHLMICGDFNLPLIEWNNLCSIDLENSFTTAFVEAMEEWNLYQHAENSTRFRNSQHSCLDLIFTNEKDMIETVSELPPLGKSDHVCQEWKLITEGVSFRNENAKRLNFKKAHWDCIKNDMANFSFDSDDSPTTMNAKLVDFISDLKDQHIPLCRVRTNQHVFPWMRSSKLKNQRKRKWYCWRKFKTSRLPRDYDTYKMERNKLVDMARMSKLHYEKELISDMKTNPNLFHGYCRRRLKTKQGVSNVVDGKGVLTETEEEAANALNEYYQSVFTLDDGSVELPEFPEQTQEIISDVLINTEMVEEVLRGLNPNKASGPDEVETRFLKECAPEMAPILCELFQKSMSLGEVPSQWKEAHIVPIHKKGPRAVMANFRPVALTSVVCKVMERIVCSAIVAFLTNNNLISQQQHGFIKGRSCQTNILLCLEKWTKILDDGNSVDVAYFDYAKAFDKVSHRLLTIKLEKYGIKGQLLHWLKDFLNDRRQRVVVGDAKSPWLPVLSGTTQGSVLGFLLFLIFINDLPKACSPGMEELIMLLADDTKTYQEINKDKDQHQNNQNELQNRINEIVKWADDNKMEIHPGKSKILHVGKDNPNMPYYISNIQIATTNEEKDIGFWVTNDLSTSTHVRKARGKALGEIIRIKRNFTCIDKRAFCVLYNQRVRPHLDYGMSACPPGTSAESKVLEATQSKATAMVHGLKHLNADERRRALGLMTLQDRRERGDLIEVFKILNGVTRIDPANFWEVREARNGKRLVKELATHGKRPRQNFFSYRVIQKWNLLPTDVKTAPSLECFKNRLDKKILSGPNYTVTP